MPRPFSNPISILSIPSQLPAKFPDFIFLTNSLTYAENCQNGGLTRFAEIKRQVSTRLGGFKRIRIFRQQLTTETLSLVMKTVSH